MQHDAEDQGFGRNGAQKKHEGWRGGSSRWLKGALLNGLIKRQLIPWGRVCGRVAHFGESAKVEMHSRNSWLLRACGPAL